jgi:predicted alpha-1,2-mannosidase
MLKLSLFLIAALILSMNLTGQEPDCVKRVNPFIGSGGEGHTYPGATVPFGMIQVSPDTEKPSFKGGFPWCAGYRYEDRTIVGFSHTHFSGTGHSDMGDILLMPLHGEAKIDPGTADKPESGYRSRFSHDQEAASPGYYQVQLLDSDIGVELSATERCAVHRYRYPGGVNPKVLLDLVHSIYDYEGKVSWAEIRVVNDTTVMGYRRSHGWAPDRTVFFTLEFSRPILQHSLFNQEDIVYKGFGVKGPRLDNYPVAKGRKIKALFEFAPGSGPLLVKVALSGVDMAGARKNLHHEMPGWDFEAVRTAARSAWEKELGKVRFKGSDQELETLYTALYHSFLSPVIYMDVDRRYRGLDGAVHRAEDFDHHTIFSLWDTYRALHPLFTILQPTRNSHMIRSMLAHQEQSAMNLLPVWSFHGNETWCMIGYHAVSVIADAWLKGIRGFDGKKALSAMVHSAETPHYGGLGAYMKHGYVPIDLEKEGASKTLEYAYDDWTIARMARDLGEDEIAGRFFRRAGNFRHIFDQKSGFMRARNSDKSFREPFDPLVAAYGGDYTEGNAWQYSWYVPQDPAGLIRLMGGDKAFVRKLDRLFTLPGDPEKYKDVEDIAGLIGQYAHGNEPSQHIAYLYPFAGRPDKTQEKLQVIMTGLFNNSPQGLPGNEDCGQMSAWYLFTSLGFYPVAPGSGQYVIGRPFLDGAEIRLENGKTFTVKVHKRSDANRYLGSVHLNGRPLSRTWISHQEILDGGTLEFHMAKEANRSWGRTASSRPYSLSNSPGERRLTDKE